MLRDVAMDKKEASFILCKCCNALIEDTSVLLHMIDFHPDVSFMLLRNGQMKVEAEEIIEEQSTFKKKPQELISCLQCDAKLRPKNLKKHLKKVHKLPRSADETLKECNHIQAPKAPKESKTPKQSNINSQQINKKIRKFKEDKKLHLSIAQNLIKSSAYWYRHPCGRPVRAPKHYNNIQSGHHGWEITFGANIFHIELAANKVINRFKKTLYEDKGVSMATAIEQDKHAYMRDVASCVSNINAFRLYQYTIRDGDFMLFGAQAIKIQPFMRAILDHEMTLID